MGKDFATTFFICKKEEKNLLNCNREVSNQESMVGSVIQARTVEFEDGLRTGLLPGGC